MNAYTGKPDSAVARLTISIPEAGERLGISRGSAYEAARSGEIPTIRIGRRKLVPVARFERLLSGENSD